MTSEKIEKYMELLSKISNTPWSLKYWLEEVEYLERKDEELILADFDYTLYSRTEELEWEKYLRENRWDAGSKAVIEIDGIHNYLNKYHTNKPCPKIILDRMDTKKDVILTYGPYEFQIKKLMARGLDKYKILITQKPSDKILKTVRYILYTLRYIPSEITIYEDRPE